jgi:hypothetical protein
MFSAKLTASDLEFARLLTPISLFLSTSTKIGLAALVSKANNRNTNVKTIPMTRLFIFPPHNRTQLIRMLFIDSNALIPCIGFPTSIDNFFNNSNDTSP